MEENYRRAQGVLVVLVLLGMARFGYVAGLEIRDTKGYIEIYHDHLWKTLLSKQLRPQEAKVLCRSMGRPADDVNVTQSELGLSENAPTLSVNLSCNGNETNVDECAMNVLSRTGSTQDKTVKLSCQGLSLYLRGGGPYDGLVFLNKSSVKLPVCVKYQFTRQMAQVICRKLGLPSSRAMVVSPYRYFSLVPAGVEIELNCSSKAQVSECEIHTTDTDSICLDRYGLSEVKVGAVLCTDEAPEYRLNYTNTDPAGMLEVKFNGSWGPVCHSAASSRFATVACNSVGSPSTDARVYEGLFNDVRLNVSLGDASCYGEEKSLGDCERSVWGSPCEKGFYIGLSCGEAYEGKVRLLSDGPDRSEGRVQVYHKSAWHDVGADPSVKPATSEATVVCKSLNLSTNSVRVRDYPYSTSLWLKDIHCNGSEDSVLECSKTPLENVSMWSQGVALYVSCAMGDDEVRLDPDGLLKVRHNGVWGTVCSRLFKNFHASIICKSLNLSSTLASTTVRPYVPLETGIVWWPALLCENNAKHWKDCRRAWGTTACSHAEDVYVTCGDLETAAVEYRLSEGPVAEVGFAEISINNTKGLICSRGFTEVEARVFCRSAGFKEDGARLILERYLERPGVLKMWLGEVSCTGAEQSILDCKHSYLGDHSCTERHSSVTVYCGDKTTQEDFSLRLAGGADSKTGRLEVMLYGQWGAICDESFGRFEAKVACEQLGLPYVLADVAERGEYGSGTGKIWLTNVSCWGSSSLKNCDFGRIGDTDCDHSRDVGITCRGLNDNDDNTLVGLTTAEIVGVVLGCIGFFVIVGICAGFVWPRIQSHIYAPNSEVPKVQYIR